MRYGNIGFVLLLVLLFITPSIGIAGNANSTPVTDKAKIAAVNTTPDITIVSSPPPLTNSNSATFTFNSSEVNSTFECQLDSGEYASCTSGTTYNNLSDGTHAFYVRAINTDGNPGTPANWTWTVDTSVPVITLTGSNPQTMEAGTAYTELNATVTDANDAGLAAMINSSAVNTGVVGTYQVTYDAVDPAGNHAVQVNRTIKVVDTSVPVITLTGANPQTIEAGTAYTELGATVNDTNDAGLNATINSSGVNTDMVGTYHVTYDAVDPAGNHAVQVKRNVKVVDTSVPVITLIGANPQTIEVGTAYTELGATVNDTNDAGLNATINSAEVNTDVVGTYQVTYDAVDPAGNHALQVKRTVIVTAASTYSVSGYVFDDFGVPLGGALVQNTSNSDTTATSGYYSISGLLNGVYNFSYSKDGFKTDYSVIKVRGSNITDANKTVFHTILPGQVTGLVSDTPTQKTVNLSWSPTANASYYKIYRNSSVRGTTQNTYWNETGLEPGTLYQYWIRANDSYNNWGENSSTLNVRTAFSTTTSRGGGSSSGGGGSGGGGSGGGGGGGGGASGENFLNIIVKEKYDLDIYKDKVTSYVFKDYSNPIVSINITGNFNSGEIGTSVEVLRNTSSLVKSSAPGKVYKNANVWVGTSGFGTSKNIKQALITFRVENSWISSNNIKSSNIKMVRWNGSKWTQLETSEKIKDSTYAYFEAKTDIFSSFAITGIETKEYITENSTIIEPTKPDTAVQSKEKKSDFLTNWFLIIGVFFAIGIIIEMFPRIKKK